MDESIVSWAWMGAAIYASAGVGFSVLFLTFRVGRMDPNAEAGTWAFRFAVLPATVALWPLLLLKVCRQSGPPSDVEWPIRPASQRRLHGAAFAIIAVVLPLLGGAALWFRAGDPPPRAHLAPRPTSGPASTGSLTRVEASKLPIHAEVSTAPDRRELKLEVSRPLAHPVVVAYWSPVATPDGVGPDAVFLGSVWGPTHLTFPLPPANAPGVLTFIELAGDHRVLETLTLK